MKVIGFTGDEIQTVYKILATILHLVMFHRRNSSPGSSHSAHGLRDFTALRQVNRSHVMEKNKQTNRKCT